MCTTDTDCGPVGYKCTAETLDVCIENPNGSINTTCRMLCTSDADCAAEFGPTATCLQPGGPSDSGCVIQPGTQACPPTFGPVVDGEDTAVVGCLAHPGIYTAKCFRYEEGMKTAWLALGPDGPQQAQAAQFPRPNAQLAIVFSTNDDDCSTADGATMNEEDWAACALLPDSTQGGPLVPVETLLAQYRSLKSDPSMVTVVALSGDSMADTEAGKGADREAYRASKTDPRACRQKTTICDGPLGPDEWGGRYQALTQAAGAHGHFENLCGPEPYANAFAKLRAIVTGTYGEACPASP